ncbi:hypothetical protein NDA11_001159 [Ustilago hordei]|uniref:uncharacterized protein n=1 Tax=Ustilago hordei TaxID=120017 RepID=UPI001A61FE48|nr:uncharacterized protein UHO2_00152 [Ustilago hordei]KAJ1044394.1 hypothetical protein NDA10_005239 [Ustilago hordei]KAJ1570565.1 hypothetical protein NDA11_001159 [Ustilago hordei]KAJ1602663.1 hypothetical protein NDA14_007875 [Ustilago hordei]UTT96893.1 hypothetical protein NDA17_001218 [Ustilago hordei]SYW81628.1 related to translation initiation protein SUA5 [Ustilago hordei]
MSSSSSPSPSSPTSPHPEAEEPGYPDRTFTTQHLPCDPTCTLTFSEAGPSRYTHAPEPYTKAIPLITSPLTRSSLSTAAAHLRSNQLVSFPSETVYGLGANALSQSAVSKIYAAKKRPADNPLIVHVSDLSMLDTLLPATYQLGAAYEALVKAFWPGALTLLFPVDVDKPAVPSVVTCGHASVAVRMPSHPIARALIATSRLPIAGPSANASGRPSPTTAAHVMRDLGGALDSHPNQEAGREHKGRLKYILDGGPCQVGVESTVVDGITAENELRVLRPGGVTVEQIEQVLKEAGLQDILKLSVYGKDMQRSSEQESKPTTPGMKYKHYSPTAPVVKLLSTKLFPSAIARPYHSNATSSTQALNSLINQSPNSTRTTPQTFAKVVREQIASLLTSSNAGTGMINIGLMTTRDSDLSRHIFSSFTASLSVHDSSGESIHRLLLPPRLLIGCEGVMIHPFDLGPCTTTEVYAQRMFDGLRTLDEGPLLGGVGRCHLIFVEALDDAGVGLAVMNRLNKAASATVLLDC